MYTSCTFCVGSRTVAGLLIFCAPRHDGLRGNLRFVRARQTHTHIKATHSRAQMRERRSIANWVIYRKQIYKFAFGCHKTKPNTRSHTQSSTKPHTQKGAAHSRVAKSQQAHTSNGDWEMCKVWWSDVKWCVCVSVCVVWRQKGDKVCCFFFSIYHTQTHQFSSSVHTITLTQREWIANVIIAQT